MEKIPLKITRTNKVTRISCLHFTHRDIVQHLTIFAKANRESKGGGGKERPYKGKLHVPIMCLYFTFSTRFVDAE